MDTERAEGIVLRCRPVTESSLIVTWFTREWGQLKTLAKGARRPKSPFRGKLDLFYRDEILFGRSRRSELHLLHDGFLENPHASLRRSVRQLTAAAYACELVELATVVEDPNPAIFALLETTLTGLEQGADAVWLIWFELQLLTAAGWGRQWAGVAGTSKVLRSLATATAPGAQRVRLSEAQVAAARTALWRVWDAELGRIPRSRRLLAVQNQH